MHRTKAEIIDEIVMLGGGDKRSQASDIAKAKQLSVRLEE